MKSWSKPPALQIDPAQSYTATIETDKGAITIELLASAAPLTVNNFVFLAKEGYYTNVPFHRIIKGFMIQTGDPTGTGSGGPGYRFADEPVALRYTRGIVAMANAGPDTNGSQFFIVHGADVGLPPNYTIFGRVTAGDDVVDAIATAPVRSNGREMSAPVEIVSVQSVTITEA